MFNDWYKNFNFILNLIDSSIQLSINLIDIKIN